MTTELAPLNAAEMEKVLIGGDLAKLSPAERLNYYQSVCQSLGLNPLTKPFDYIVLNGKMRLYALKDATEQLRRIHGVSITDLSSQNIGGVFVVTAKAQDKGGRTDAATGAVPCENLRGEALANALMKAETKAKRRVTLSLCGLGMLDEAELETIGGANKPTETAVAPTANTNSVTEKAVIIEGIEDCASIADLQAYWKTNVKAISKLAPPDRDAVEDAKNNRKEWLTQNA